MRSNPLVVNAPGQAGQKLSRFEVKANDVKSEAWLQDVLYSHPELLPVSEFDDHYFPAIPLGREVPTGRGPIDNLYVSPAGGLTLVETKLWKNPEKHRTVVAQILDYAKEVAAWDYDRLAEAVLAAARANGETENVSLEQKVAAALRDEEMELHEFQEGVSSCLAQGKFLLLIVGDRISPNIALLSNVIHSAPGLHFTLGLVEMQLFALTAGADWPVLVVPEVLGRTVEKTRGVVTVRFAGVRPEVEVAAEMDDADEPVAAGQLNQGTFLSALPADLAPAFTEGIASWESIGGAVRFAPATMFLEMDLAGASRKVVRCRSHKISVVLREFVVAWGGTEEHYAQYLADLESAPVAADHARCDKLWIGYDKLSGEALQAVLRAAQNLVQRIQSNS